MKQQVVVIDVGGYTERLRALQEAHPHVVGITPHDRPCEGFTSIVTPEEWLPLNTYPDSYSRRCWWACGKLGLAAIRELALDADFYWMIESDCVATLERWQELLADHADNPADGVFAWLKHRGNSPNGPFWDHPGTPATVNTWHINAIYRLSRRAVDWCLESAEASRETFGELSIGSEIVLRGGTLSLINRGQGICHLNCQTMKADPMKMIPRHDLICHPVKSNSAEVPKRSLQFRTS